MCTTLLGSDLSVGSEQVTPFWHFFISISIFHTDKIYNSVHSITSQCLEEPPLKYLHSPQVAWNYRPANLMQRSSQLSLSVVLPNEKWQPRNKLLLRGFPGHLLSQFGSTSVILTSNTLQFVGSINCSACVSYYLNIAETYLITLPGHMCLCKLQV